MTALPVPVAGLLSSEDLSEVRGAIGNPDSWRQVVNDAVRARMDYIYQPQVHWLHFALRHRITEALGGWPGDATDRAMPSYCYALRYTPGSELLRHTDRKQCEWTISILIDDGGYEWPLIIEGAPLVCREPGDAIIYQRTMQHWRKPLPADAKPYTVLLLHYVPADFRGGIF
jgi:hypothetical protein